MTPAETEEQHTENPQHRVAKATAADVEVWVPEPSEANPLSAPCGLLDYAERWLKCLKDVKPFEEIYRGQLARDIQTDEGVIQHLRRRNELIQGLLDLSEPLKVAAHALELDGNALARGSIINGDSLRPEQDLSGAAHLVQQIHDWAREEVLRSDDPAGTEDRQKAILARKHTERAAETTSGIFEQTTESRWEARQVIADRHAVTVQQVARWVKGGDLHAENSERASRIDSVHAARFFEQRNRENRVKAEAEKRLVR